MRNRALLCTLGRRRARLRRFNRAGSHVACRRRGCRAASGRLPRRRRRSDGVLATDHLDLDERARDRRPHARLPGPLAPANDERLTSDGICLPWIWERDLITLIFLPTITCALALAQAVDRHRPRTLTAMARDGVTEHVVEAVAASRGIDVDLAGERRPAPLTNPTLRVPSRRRAIASLLALGSTVAATAWQRALPELLADGAAARPPAAGSAAARRSGCSNGPPGRGARYVRPISGGWVGAPGPHASPAPRRRGPARSSPRRPRPDLAGVEGLELGPCLHAQVLTLARRRAAGDLATAIALQARARQRGRSIECSCPMTRAPDAADRLAREGGGGAEPAGGPRRLPSAAHPGRHDGRRRGGAVVDARSAPAYGATTAPLHVVGYPVPTAMGRRARLQPTARRGSWCSGARRRRRRRCSTTAT